MRRASLLIASALFLSNLFTGVATAAVPGSKCAKAGITKIVATKKYTCVKSGKTLVWNKGVSIKSASPGKSGQSSNENSKPEPTPSEASLLAPTSFADLYERRDAISYTAWKLTGEAMKNGKSNLVNFTSFVGPNTKPTYKTPKTAYGLVSRAFSNFKTPKDVYVIQYGMEDINWADAKIKSIVTDQEYNQLQRNEGGRLVTSNCSNDCYGAKQVTTDSGLSFILQGVSKTSNNDPMGYARWNLGHLDAHEFFHAMQRENALEWQAKTKEWPASWIVEGGAELVQNLVMSSASFEEYTKWRRTDSQNILGPNSIVTPEFMAKFLDLVNNKDYWRGVDSYYSYNLGARIMETMVALKGPGVLLDIYTQTVRQGFEAGFQEIFGVSWAEASPVINKTVVQLLKEGK